MERMVVVSSNRVTRDVPRRRPDWQLRPRTAYPLVPLTRRLEWLAFIATPIGGIMAVVDSGSAGGIGVACCLVALVIGVPWLLISLLYVLPGGPARVLNYTLTALVGLFLLSVAALIALAATEAFIMLVAIAAAIWGGCWLWDRRKLA